MCVYIHIYRHLYVCIYEGIYCKESDHRIMETDKSSLPSVICKFASSRPRTVYSSSGSWSLNTGRAGPVHSSLSVRGNWCPSPNQSGRKREHSFIFPFGSIQPSERWDLTHPHWQRADCFRSDFNVNLSQKHRHRQTQNNVPPNIRTAGDPVKMTHKNNHHIRSCEISVFMIGINFVRYLLDCRT